VVQQATAEDQRGNIDEAVQLYSVAVGHFQDALSEDIEEKVRKLIQEKSEMYVKRMEHLRFLLLQDQFPETPAREDEVMELEKQFADIPVSDHGYEFNRHQVKSANSTPQEDRKAPPSENPDDEEPPIYASRNLNEPIRADDDLDVSTIEGPTDPEVVAAIEETAKWINQAKEAEAAGDMTTSVAYYRKGLTYLYRAYNKEPDFRIKELVRIKYNCLVSRMEEVESSLTVPKEAKVGTMGSSVALIEQYTGKARALADGFDFSESIKYYNMAMVEIKKAMAREDVAEAQRWLAKRALVTERRIGGISTVLPLIKIALPYPWNKLFGLVEYGLRASGYGIKAQATLDKKLSKMAGVEYQELKEMDKETIDLAKNLIGSATGTKKSKKKK